MIGSADGTQYETMTQYALSLHPEGKENGPIISEIKPDKSKQPQPMTDPDMWKEPGYINQDHHVPLVASAIMDPEGKMTGMAVDHRLNLSDDDKGLLHLHESTELPWMQDLMKAGYSPQDAYHEAHDHATARETAASLAKWGEDGHEAYKGRMRDNASIAAEPSDRERHPDAHTTRYGLDKTELDYDYEGAKAAGVKPDARGHYPDTYKLPNHITFSDESIHNKGGAGHWEDLGNGKWSFTPGPENLKHHSMDDLREYFKKYEPDSQLIEPNQDQTNQKFASNFKPINPMQPSYTNPGGHEKEPVVENPGVATTGRGGWRGNPKSLEGLESRPNKKVELDKDVLQAHVESGKSIRQIAKEMGTSGTTVASRLSEYGLKSQNPSRPPFTSKTFTKEEINRLREVMPYVSHKEAARIFDKTPDQIRRAVEVYDIETGMQRRPISNEDKETIQKMFEEGKSLREIGRTIGRPHSSFRHLLPDQRLIDNIDWWDK